MTVIAPRGMSTETFFKLCVRAPRTESQSLPCLCAPAADFFFSMRRMRLPYRHGDVLPVARQIRQDYITDQNSDQQPDVSTTTDFVTVEPLSVVQEMV